MPRRSIIATALVATAALAIGPGTAAPASNRPAKEFSCTLEITAQGVVPSPSGIHFGFAECPAPFGKGLHFNAFTATPPPPAGGPATVNAHFKNYYDRGTTSGTATMTFIPGTPSITYRGSVTYTGGTGRFRRVRGGGTIECTTTDGGAHKSCTVRSTLTGV